MLLSDDVPFYQHLHEFGNPFIGIEIMGWVDINKYSP